MKKNLPHVTILGAGPVGLVTAILLKRLGFTLSLFECKEEIEFLTSLNERSVNITLSAKGIETLKEIDAWQHILPITQPINGRVYPQAKSFKTLPYTKLPDHNIYSIKREAFLATLIEHAKKEGVEINWGYEATGIDKRKKTMTIKNRSKQYTQNYEFLICANGVNSNFRKFLNLHCKTVDEDIIYQKIEMTPEEARQLGLTGEKIGVINEHSSLFISIPNKDGSHSAMLNMRRGTLNKILNQFQQIDSMYPILSSIINEFPKQISSNKEGSFRSIYCREWYGENILLIGDCAHGMLPMYGQGTNCGLQDALILSNFIEAYPTIQEACFNFQKVRIPSAKAITDLSRLNLNGFDKPINFEFVFAAKNLESALELRFEDYFSEYFKVAFSHSIPYEVAMLHRKLLAPKICAAIKKYNLSERESLSTIELDKIYKSFINKKYAP